MLSGKVYGYDSLWIIGGDFAANTFPQCVANAKRVKELYIKTSFDLYPFMTDSRFSHIRSFLGRIRNEFAQAILQQVKFPKAILVILDNDLLRACKFDYKKPGLSKLLSGTIDWLLNEVRKLIEIRKDQLPVKAVRANYPMVYWVEAPQHKSFHDNLERCKFNSVLQSLTGMKQNMKIIRMKKIWDENDSNLFRQGRFTADGLMRYWESIDNAIQFNENIQQIMRENQLKKNSYGGDFESSSTVRGGRARGRSSRGSHFSWTRGGHPSDWSKFAHQRKLPRPPPK